jgi:single-stranded DNA-specific DHH superfamily exonuclease
MSLSKTKIPKNGLLSSRIYNTDLLDEIQKQSTNNSILKELFAKNNNDIVEYIIRSCEKYEKISFDNYIILLNSNISDNRYQGIVNNNTSNLTKKPPKGGIPLIENTIKAKIKANKGSEVRNPAK